jgi:hypothetical protein
VASVTDQIAGLAGLSPAQLRAEWRRLHRNQPLPEGMSTDLMTRVIAWRLQEKAFGGLPPARLRELARLAKQLETIGELDLEQQRQLKPGTRLVRQWHGKPYVVTVLEEGYEFEERNYASLTPIARQITGAAWSGPRFFGLPTKSEKRHEPEG